METKKAVLKVILTAMIGVTSLGGLPVIGEATPSNSGSYTERMNSLEAKEVEAEEQLQEIVLSIEKTETEATDIVSEIDETAKELELIKKEIEELNSTISQREEQLKTQVRAVQVTRQSGEMLRFLMEADNLSDVLGRLDVVSTLFSANQGLMEKQVADKEMVEAKERETIGKQEEQTLMAAKLENKKVLLEEQKAEQEMLVAAIAADKTDLAEEREAFLTQQRESEQRLNTIQTARRAAEEATIISVSSDSSNDETSTEEVSTSSSKTVEEVPTPAASGSIIGNAQSLIGVKYVYGGSTPAGFDCSGFTAYAFQRAGISLPRSAAAQYGASKRISQSEVKPGDLIFFSQSGSIDHVGIYLGGGRFIGSQTSTGVAVASFTSGYWSRYVAGFGRP